jgi:hypothetical protein
MQDFLFCFYKKRQIPFYLIPIFILNIAFTSNAQVKPNLDFSSSIIQTKSGGYALTGKTYPNGGDVAGVYVVNLDSTGNINWTKTISGKYDESGNSIIQSRDGGYALTGETYSSDFSGQDVYVVKLDAAGNINWTKSVGGMDDEFGYSIVQINDGSYFITGATSSIGAEGENVYVVKIDSTGNIKWKRTIDGPKFSHGSSIILTSDGGYAIGGYREASADAHENTIHYDFSIIKLDSAGNVKWNKTIGGAGSKSTYSMVQTKDGGYAITGAIDSSAVNNQDVYVVKLDTAGNSQWTKTIGGASKDVGAAIIQTQDGGYAITGATKSSGAGSFDVYAIKLDAIGKVIWTKTIGGEGDDEGESIVQTSDGGYAIGGFTNAYKTSDYKFYAIKLDAQGNQQWVKSIGAQTR